MGIFQRYIKTDTNGNPVMGKNGKPVREGPWFIQYPSERDPQSGKVKYRTEKASFSKKKAEKMFRSKCDAFQEMEKFGVQIDTEMTFSELMDWGLKQEVMKNKASESDDAARAVHLKTYFGDCKAVQISPLNVNNFRIKMKRTVSERTKKPFSGSTINKMVSLARRVYYLGMDAGMVKSNPFARRGTFKEEPKGQYVSDDAFWRIYKHLPSYLQPVSVTAYLTGMRRGEIIGLRWNRVDLFGGYIDLTKDDTKTDDPRRIYFHSVKALKDVFVEAARKRKPEQEFVFTNPDGNPVPKWYMERVFKKACLDAGVGPYRFHDLRHTFNTNMLKAGVKTAVIMKLTGHKTDAMFSRYTHLDEELGTDAMKKLVTYMADKKGDREGSSKKRKQV